MKINVVRLRWTSTEIIVPILDDGLSASFSSSCRPVTSTIIVVVAAVAIVVITVLTALHYVSPSPFPFVVIVIIIVPCS